jgi:glutaredoxin
MSYEAKLIYFESCPNAKQAIKLLNNLNLKFELILQDDLDKEHPNQSYSSPTLILNNQIVFGSKTGNKTGGCSIQLPSDKIIQTKLQTLGILTTSNKRGLLGTLGGLASAGLVGFCPVCIPAVAGFLSAIGLGFMVSTAILKPLLITFILITLGGFFWSYKKEHKNIAPLLVGSLMALSLYAGRYIYLDATLNPFLLYGGILGIIIVSFWNLYLRKKNNCSACEI